MDRKHLIELMEGMVDSSLLEETRPAHLGALMFDVLADNWDNIDESIAGILLAIAGTLMKGSGQNYAEAKAAMLLARVQGKIPKMAIDGEEKVIVDRAFTFHVSKEKDTGKWVATCYAIGLSVVSDDPLTLQQESFKQFSELAKKNGLAAGGDTFCIDFKMV